MSENIKLTSADIQAISYRDAEYLNEKGADYYYKGKYEKAVEYYRLASSMGDIHATSNLGYCYLYGRSIEPNTSLALAYFRIAAQRGDVDAAYKLGDIYSSDKWGLKDTELSVYYYKTAADSILEDVVEDLEYITQLQDYPSLCFALGREMSESGNMVTDYEKAYKFLKHAEKGYLREILNGNKMYEKVFENLADWLNDPQFDSVRDRIDPFFEEFDYIMDFEEDSEDNSIDLDGIN